MKVKSSSLLIWLYFFNMIVVPNGSIVSKSIKVLFVGFAFLYIISKKKHLKWHSHFTWLILFTILSFASIYWASSREYAIRGVSTIALNSLCVIMLGIILLNVNNWIKIVIPCICIFPVLLFLRLFIMHGTAVLGGLRNVEGGMHNTVGMYAGFGVSFAVFFINYANLKNRKTDERTKWWALIIVNALICMLTMSRKAMVYLILPIVLGLLFSGKNITKKVRNVFLIIIGTIAAYIILTKVPLLYNYIGKGIENAINYFLHGTGDISAAGRNTRINYGLLLFSRTRWIGYGAMNYNYLFYNFESLTDMTVADNNFIDIAVNSGIVGLVVYYSEYVTNIIRYIKKCPHGTFTQAFPFALLLTLLIADYGVSAYLYLHSQTFFMLSSLLISLMMFEKKTENR